MAARKPQAKKASTSTTLTKKVTSKGKNEDKLITEYPNDDLAPPAPDTALEKRAERSLSRDEKLSSEAKAPVTSASSSTKKGAANWQDMGKVSNEKHSRRPHVHAVPPLEERLGLYVLK